MVELGLEFAERGGKLMMVTWQSMGVGVVIGIRGIWVGRLWSDGREGRWVRREVGKSYICDVSTPIKHS